MTTTPNIVNCTPHDIVVINEEGVKTTYAKSGLVARVETTPGARKDIPGVPCAVFEADTVVGIMDLPEPVPGTGTFYIVSGFVGNEMKGQREDLLVPGTGPKDNPLRNEKGWIVAVRCLKGV